MESKRFRFDLVGCLRQSLPHAPQVVRAGSASSFEELRELTERLREPVNLDDVELTPAQRPPAGREQPASPAPASSISAPHPGNPVYGKDGWERLRQDDLANCREYFKQHGCMPSQKMRHNKLKEKHPASCPHFKTLWKPGNLPRSRDHSELDS